jgi:hypothetical protein
VQALRREGPGQPVHAVVVEIEVERGGRAVVLRRGHHAGRRDGRARGGHRRLVRPARGGRPRPWLRASAPARWRPFISSGSTTSRSGACAATRSRCSMPPPARSTTSRPRRSKPRGLAGSWSSATPCLAPLRHLRTCPRGASERVRRRRAAGARRPTKRSARRRGPPAGRLRSDEPHVVGVRPLVQTRPARLPVGVRVRHLPLVLRVETSLRGPLPQRSRDGLACSPSSNSGHHAQRSTRRRSSSRSRASSRSVPANRSPARTRAMRSALSRSRWASAST